VEVCQWAGKFDLADRLLRDAIAQARQVKGSVSEQNQLGNDLGFLAVNLLLQGRFDEAEPFAREAVEMSERGEVKHYYWVGALGAVLVGQRKYAEAEPLLLQGYEGSKRHGLADYPANRKRLTKMAGWIVHLYEGTNQRDKAREWRERTKASEPSTAPPIIK